jgi:hypothetical protein
MLLLRAIAHLWFAQPRYYDTKSRHDSLSVRNLMRRRRFSYPQPGTSHAVIDSPIRGLFLKHTGRLYRDWRKLRDRNHATTTRTGAIQHRRYGFGFFVRPRQKRANSVVPGTN